MCDDHDMTDKTPPRCRRRRFVALDRLPSSHRRGTRARFRLERGDPCDALDLDAAPEAAGALLLRDHPACGVVEPQPQQVALAVILRPILVFAPRVQHDEVVEELDVAAAEIDVERAVLDGLAI